MHTPIDKLVLSTRDSYHLIEVESIIYCKSDNSCTTFYLVGGEKIKVSVSMKNVEKKLGDKNFIRPHQSYLVNVRHIKTIQKTGGGDLILDSGESITISIRKKGEIMHFLGNIKRIQV